MLFSAAQRSAAAKSDYGCPDDRLPYLRPIDPTISLSKLRKAKKKVKQGVQDRLDR